jgi:pimeloyl-ACP methyl ester carboxylesterase
MTVTWTPSGTTRGRIVLLHGVMSSAATWWRIGPALAARGWQADALDLPAHGGSARPGQPLTLDALAEGVASQLTVPADVIAGHSLGAITALALAARYPSLARALILEDPPATAVATDPALAEGIARDAALARTDRDLLVRREREANPRWLDGDVQRSVDGIATADAAAITSGLRGPGRWNLPALMATAPQIPVLVLAAPPGPGSFALSGGSALQEPDRSWLRDTLPPGRFIVLGSGHCLHRDQPERWVTQAHAFAAAIVP